MNTIPKSLRSWFIVHGIVDFVFALPLILTPEWFLGFFGFVSITPVLARLVGAALLAIGGTSFFCKTKEQFETMLTFKIIWSVVAILGVLWSLAEGAPSLLWPVVAIFAFFSGVWIYYKR